MSKLRDKIKFWRNNLNYAAIANYVSQPANQLLSVVFIIIVLYVCNLVDTGWLVC